MTTPKAVPRERSIILTDREARGCIDGRIGMLWRVIRPQPVFHPRLGLQWKGHHYGIQTSGEPYLKTFVLECPFGFPGGRLACRETWEYRTNEPKRCLQCGARQPASYCIKGCEYRFEIAYKADGPGIKHPYSAWRSPATMPRWAVRTVVEIIEVQAQRLQTITFVRLWDSYHKLGQRWADNPWCWALRVRRIA